MNEKIDKIVELDIDDNFFEEEIEGTGVEIVSLVDAPAIQADFLYFNEEKFVEPNAGESEEDFIGRCMKELESEFPDRDQRLAVCYSYYDKFDEQFESYNDYPEGARNNACRAVEYAEENGWGDCGTAVGKRRASQLCNGENITEDTIARMAAFERHRQNSDTPYTEGCGGLMWDAWGGSAGIRWAQGKLDEIRLYKDKKKKKKRKQLSDEQKLSILEFCEDDRNGEYINYDDVYLDFTKVNFAGVGDVIKAIRGLDILKRLSIKKDQPAEIYWRYSGPPAQRDFCKAMVNLANRGKIFTDAEIRRMNNVSSTNPGMGEGGSNNYSVLQFNGGVNCTHYWQKLKVFKGDNGKKVVIATNEADNTEETNAMKSQNANKPGPLGSVPNNARVNFSFNEEKRIVTGPLMIPNKFILRRDEDGNPFYIYFTRKTIRKMAEKFFKDGKNNNTDINHDENVTKENTLIESWISESIQHDKAYKYGFTLPPGTWYVSYKINDDDTWKKIKSGELKGFSLAGGFIQKMKPVDPEKTLNDIKDILNKVK